MLEQTELGTVKPEVSRSLDVFSTPKTDDEAKYILILMTEKSGESRLFNELIWGLYSCHRAKGKNVLDAWILALEAAVGKSS